MDERDYRNYQDLFAEMVHYLRPPDVIIYLRARPETILERIRARGRDMESDIEPDYIHELHDAYENWSKHIHRTAPLHVVDTDRVDLKHDRAAQEELTGRLLQMAASRTEQAVREPDSSRESGRA